STGLAANQLQRIRILLLGHQRRPGRNSIRKLYKAKLGCRVDDQVFGKPAKMHHCDRGRADELNHEITIAYRIDTVVAHSIEAKPARYQFAIEWKPSSRQSARSQ